MLNSVEELKGQFRVLKKYNFYASPLDNSIILTDSDFAPLVSLDIEDIIILNNKGFPIHYFINLGHLRYNLIEFFNLDELIKYLLINKLSGLNE